MKIYYIANLENKYSTEQSIFKALLFQGYDVQIVEESLFTGKEHLQMSKGFDLLLFAKGRVKDGDEGLKYLLKNFRGKKAFWLFDKMYDFRPERAQWMDQIIPLVDIYFVTDGSAIQHYKKLRTPFFILRQGAEKYIGKPKREYQAFDVAFFGSLYTDERKEMLRVVGEKYKLITSNFQDPYQFRGKTLANVCKSVPIVIADALPFDNYWSNRIYEMLGAGAFLIHPNIKGLEREFQDKKHYVGYKLGDFDDLMRKIKYYLNRTKTREKIAMQGQEYATTKFSYDKRVRDLMKLIHTTYAL